MATGEVVHFSPDGANLIGFPSVQAQAFVEHEVTDGLFLSRLDVVACHAALLLTVFVGHGVHEGSLQFREAVFALFFGGTSLSSFVKLGVHVCHDVGFPVLIVGFVGVFALDVQLAHLFGEFVLGFALGANGSVGHLNGVHHLSFADLAHFTFHHDNAVHGACDHDVHVRFLQFGAKGVDHELTPYARHAHFRNGAVKRNV